MSEKRNNQTSTAALLRTKLTLPPVRPDALRRGSLVNALERGVDGRLTLLSAPAGSGKTSIVSAWLAPRAAKGEAAWVSLDEGDNDPVRFWRYVITACQAFEPSLGEAALAGLQSMPPAFETALTLWLNELVALDKRCVLTLEDYHLITEAQVHDTLAFLLEHLPDTLHLVIVTRAEPPLPLARLRVRGQLAEFGAADLRFTGDEIRAFVKQAIPFALSSDAVAHLEARTEGWAAGLRLAVLALGGRGDGRLQTFTGTHRHIFDYLIEDVFAAQPSDIQNFLLQTAFLNRLNAELCDTVTGRANSAAMLAQVERANLFLLPLEGGWYRYHPLFAEALQHYARTRGVDLPELYRRAGRWYEAHGLADEAVRAAFDAGEFGRAAELIDRFIEPFAANNEYHTLCGLIERLPDDVLNHHPRLCFTFAIGILFTSDRRDPDTWMRIQKPLRIAEGYWEAKGNEANLGQALAFRAMAAWWQGDVHQSFAASHHALELLPMEDVHWRAVAMTNLGFEAFLAGRLNEGRHTLASAATLFESVHNNYGQRACLMLIAEICLRQGELRHAGQFYQDVLDDAAEDPSDYAYALFGLAWVACERDDLETAERLAREAYNLSKELREDETQARSALVLAQALQARGAYAEAQGLLGAVEALPRLHKWPLQYREIRACRALLALRSGDLQTAQEWFAACETGADSAMRIQQATEALVAARLFIAQGEIQEALRLLDQWQIEARSHNHQRAELDILILKSLAYAGQDQRAQAAHTLLKALKIAEAEGYLRAFLDEGRPLADLLRYLLPTLADEALGRFARRLLLAFGQAAGADTPLIEPLSPQERRVLRLLSAGLSNPEIADELIVSINTVKTQVKSIYRKLNVSTRDEARDLAMQMQLG
jgi:LuxR family maltose regulon positive regulatory protein